MPAAIKAKVAAQVEANRIAAIISQAKGAARDAAESYFKENLRGHDAFPCGFAWVRITGVKGNTKLGKNLAACGFSKAYNGGMEIWNPSGLPVQNVDVKEHGASKFADLIRLHLKLPEGCEVRVESRLD